MPETPPTRNHTSGFFDSSAGCVIEDGAGTDRQGAGTSATPIRSGGRLAVPAWVPLALVVGAAVSGCVQRVPRTQPPTVLVGSEEVLWKLEPAPLSALTRLGIEVSHNEGESLESLEDLPGVRVRRVTGGTPAKRIDLRVDDVILSVNGTAVDDAEQLDHLLARATAEGSASTPPLSLEFRRGSVGFVATVSLPAEARAERRVHCRIDPVATRAAYAFASDGAVVVQQLFPQSPLPGVGITVGTHLIAIDDVPIQSPAQLVAYLLEEVAVGQEVTLQIADALPSNPAAAESTETERDNFAIRSLRLRTWSPGRVTTRVRVPILFDYQHNVGRDTTEWALLDLWLIKLFGYRREKEERRYNFLGFQFATGVGELQEVQVANTPAAAEEK